MARSTMARRTMLDLESRQSCAVSVWPIMFSISLNVGGDSEKWVSYQDLCVCVCIEKSRAGDEVASGPRNT
jgi:hypothetical protein